MTPDFLSGLLLGIAIGSLFFAFVSMATRKDDR